MVEYSKVSVKLTDNELKKLKTAFKNKTGTILRKCLMEIIYHMNYCWQQDKKTKLINAFNSNTSTDLKLSKAQISKIITSGGFLGSLLTKLAGPLMKVAIRLAKNVLVPLGITAAASAIDAGNQKNPQKNTAQEQQL